MIFRRIQIAHVLDAKADLTWQQTFLIVTQLQTNYQRGAKTNRIFSAIFSL